MSRFGLVRMVAFLTFLPEAAINVDSKWTLLKLALNEENIACQPCVTMTEMVQSNSLGRFTLITERASDLFRLKLEI